MSNKSAIEALHKKWAEIGSRKSMNTLEVELDLYKKLLDIVQVGRSYYFVFNPSIQTIEFTSDSVENVLEILPQMFTLEYILNNIHPDDLNRMADFETAVVAFKKELPPEKIMKYKTRYNYRLRSKNGTYLHMLQQSITVQVDDDGKILRNLAFHTDISEISDFKEMKLAFIGLDNEPSFEGIQPLIKFSKSKELFSKRELEVLKFVVQGMNSHTIATNINRSVHTIRNHRKKILKKSGCENIQELLVKSIREGWV